LITVLCALACLLAAVAFLQFRSTAQVDDATEERVGGNLESLMIDWHLDFYRQFSAICVALQVGPDSGAFDDWSVFSDRYSQWRQTTQTPHVVQNLYIWETSQRTDPRLLSLESPSRPPRLAAQSPNFLPLLARLQSRSGNLYSALRAWQANDPDRARKNSSSRSLPLAGDPLTGWQFDQNIPAIVHPIVHHKLPMEVDNPSSPEAVDWMIIVLDVHIIGAQIFPALALRHFGPAASADYSVAVAALGTPNRVLYDSSSDAGKTEIDKSDAAMNIFGPPPASIEDNFWLAVQHANAVKMQNWHHFSGPIWFPVIHYSNEDHPWMLILTHRKGHLEDVVAKARRINILINGVVLILLAAGITTVVIASHGAQQYARLQMDFVASISHELRTPLTAIYSAGENLADGVVEKRSQLQHYGSIIKSQTRQLINLVDQILTFASSRSGEMRYEMRPLEVASVIDLALESTQAAIQASGFKVEVEIEPCLPPIMGDPTALASCIQNLLANALKYSGKSRWIRVSALPTNAGDREEIEIRVEDRGIGIAPSELTDVFKSFYRSSQVKAAQIHGTGLGLSVAKAITEAMGGRISVSSSLGVGTTFALAFPASLTVHQPKPRVEEVIQ
jgi:signal transduction histidine kinase